MEDLTTDRSFDLQDMWVIDVFGIFFSDVRVIHGCLNNQVLADVQLTGAGIRCLYCRLHDRHWHQLQLTQSAHENK